MDIPWIHPAANPGFHPGFRPPFTGIRVHGYHGGKAVGKVPGCTWISPGKRVDDLDSNIQDTNGIPIVFVICLAMCVVE